MKLSFSTLACPNFSFDDVCSIASDFGFAGFEIRGIEGERFDAFTDALSRRNIAATSQKLRTMHLSVSCLSSGCYVGDKDSREANLDTLREYIAVASKIGCSYIRLLGDDGITATHEVDDDEVYEQVNALLPYAAEHGVTLLIETNGVYADTARLKSLLTRFCSDNVGALWDIHHPYRFAGESPETTLTNLGIYIKYVHVKDSVIIGGKPSYKLMGEGDMPISDMINALRSINYDGYITLEYVKRWSPELEEADIVIPQFCHFMAQFADQDRYRGSLIKDLRGEGYYIWPKNTLIDLTFPQVLDRVCEEFGDQNAFCYTELDYTRTYRQFRDDVDEFARALISLGIKRGDHVAVWATNTPQWFITFWATVKIGAVLVTVNTAYKIYELEYLLRQSDTTLLVMTDGYKDTSYTSIISELCPELNGHDAAKPLFCRRLPFLRYVVTTESRVDGCLHWSDALAFANQTPIEEVLRRAASINKNDVCNMQYTSGTTGFPKGVMLTHYNVVNNGKNIGDCMDLSSADRMMIQVPMFHCFGMVLSMTASITHAVTMSPITAFSPRKGLDCINRQKITCMQGVPTMYIAMLGHENFAKTDFSHMRTGIMAGSPCPIKVMQEVIERMHLPEICITYGQTEASPGCTMSKTTDSIEDRVNTVGGAMFGVECKIVDPETGAELPDGTDGEFVARGYNVMKGYYKMPHATALAIDANGWLHTGDLARRLPGGYFKITGRIKDMIIRGGENIYPKEIEDFIYTHPKVKDVQVIGVPDAQYGEEILACVIPEEGSGLTEDELREFIIKNLAKHKVPRYIRFVSEFPMNAAGKILKYKMREQAIAELGLGEASKIVTA